MAGSPGFGGVGALAIGGVTTVVVIAGTIAATQFGLLDGKPSAQQPTAVSPEVQTSAPRPSATVTSEPAPIANPAPAVTPPTEQVPPSAQTATDDSQPVQPGAAVDTKNVAAAADTNNQTAETPASATTETPAAAAPLEVAESTDVVSDTVPSPIAPSPIAPPSDSAPGATPPAEADVAALTANVSNADDSSIDAPKADDPGAGPELAILSVPSIDVIRFDPDGAGLIAGRATPGSSVEILIDGAVVDIIEVGGSGEFVAFPVVEPTAVPRVVTLQGRRGEELALSNTSFILAPTAPARLAQADSAAPASELVGNEPGQTGPETAPKTAPEAGPETASETGPDITLETGSETAPDTPLETAEAPVVPLSEGPVHTPVAETEDSGSAATMAVVADAAAQATDSLALLGTVTASGQQPHANRPAPTTGVAVLRAGPDGVEVVQPAQPVAPELADTVALDVISYTPAGELVLAGRARPAALVRVYIDNRPVGEILSGVAGRWRGQIDDIDPGIYTLRLDEIDPLEGAVLSRVETPFKRESPAVLVQPVGADGVSLDGPLASAVTVQKGDTLWAISQERYGDGFLFVRVFEANRNAIRDPDLIYPGQVFSLPE